MLSTEEFRYRTIRRQCSLMQRLRAWWIGVINAIRKSPDSYWVEWILVRKGEPGYDEAQWGCSVVEDPIRYTYENGRYAPVGPSKNSSLKNPNYKDAET